MFGIFQSYFYSTGCWWRGFEHLKPYPIRLIVKSQETYKTVIDIYSLFTIVIIIVVLSIYYGRQQSLIYFLYIVHPYCTRATLHKLRGWMKSKSQQVFVKLSFELFGIFHALSTDVGNGELFFHQHETEVVLTEPFYVGAFSEDLFLHFHTRGHPCYESTRICIVCINIPQWYRNRVKLAVVWKVSL